MFERLRRRQHHAPVADELRRLIAELGRQREAAATASARLFADRAEVQRACDAQLATLRAALTQAADAQATARRAGERARQAGDGDAGQYAAADRGFDSVRELLAAAAEPIEVLRRQTDRTQEQARATLAQAQRVLDEQIRAQIRLLTGLERAERRAAAAALRRARRQT